MRTSTWIKTHTASLSGKTVAISGATGGIGRELCRHLVSLGASLVLLDRNQARSGALEEELRALSPALHVRRIPLDLADVDSVRRAADLLCAMPIDAVIFNAGVYQVPRYRCAAGVDNVFQINFLSPYYLARRLKPQLQARGGKIVAVGSITHTNSPTDPADIDFSSRTKSSLFYGNSKRFLMFALYGLFDGEPGLAVTHPGITLTNISAHHPPAVFNLIKHPMKVIFMPPRRACLSILRGLFEDCSKNEWIGPRWFRIWGLPSKQVLHTCSDEEAAWIFETAERLVQNMET